MYLTKLLIFTLLFVVSLAIQVKLSSGGNQSEISQTDSCSCELVVFAYSTEDIIMHISDLPSDVTTLDIEFIQLNQTLANLIVEDHKRTLTLPMVSQPPQEYTQTFKITLHAEQIQYNPQWRKVYLVRMNNEYSYSITIPQNAILLTQIYACVLTLVISQNIKYRRFTPKAFNFLFAILYSIMLFMTVYLQVLLQTVPAEWILNVFSLFFIAVYFVDILSIFIDRKLILGILSLTFSVFIMLMDVILLPNTWFANNIVASLVSAAIVKFIVIKKLKGAMLPLTVLWIFFIIRQIGMVIHIQDFQHTMEIRIVPLFLQIPAVFNDSPDGYICSAFGTSKIIAIGLLLNYAVRLDLSLSSNFYKITIGVIALGSLLIELLFGILVDDLPIMEYFSVLIFLPLSVGTMLLFAVKRGQWPEVWHGSFHDISVNRQSLRRDSDLNLSTLEESFNGLRLTTDSLITSQNSS